MSKTYYNLPGVEELEAFVMSTHGHLEESAHNLLTHSATLADGTRGQMADSHEETAQISDQVSAKGREVIQLIHNATQEAREQTIAQDSHGASMVGLG